jgi:hypothetical protein
MMSNNPTTPRRGSETGMMPRIDPEPDAAHESPLPPAIPEFDSDATSITGKVPLFNEGEDEAKLEDDSSNLDSDQQPRQLRARRR